MFHKNYIYLQGSEAANSWGPCALCKAYKGKGCQVLSANKLPGNTTNKNTRRQWEYSKNK